MKCLHICIAIPCAHFIYYHKVQMWWETYLRSHLVGVIGVNPCHLEHVFDFFSEADACSTVGCNVNAGDALGASKLRRPEEQLILLRTKGADHVSDVITDDNDVSALRVLWSLHLHPEGDHSHLVKSGYSGYQYHHSEKD